MGSTRERKMRDALYLKNLYCPICGVKMVLPKDIARNPTGNLITQPPNLCTYEHSRSRLNPERGKPTYGKRVNGILCAKCNVQKGHQDEREFLTFTELSQRGMQPILSMSFSDRILYHLTHDDGIELCPYI